MDKNSEISGNTPPWNREAKRRMDENNLKAGLAEAEKRRAKAEAMERLYESIRKQTPVPMDKIEDYKIPF